MRFFLNTTTVLLLLTLGATVGCARKTPDPIAPRPQTVTVTTPIVKSVTDYEVFAGRTEPYRMVELRSRVTGYLDTVHFKDGDDVVFGEPLFDIDSRTYKAERDRAEAALVKAQKRFETIGLLHERVRVSFDKGIAGTEAVETAKGELDVAEAEVTVAAADLELADANLKFTHITAPFAGRVSRRMADPGNLIKADETLLTTVVTLDPIYAAFDIDERTVMRFRELIRRGEFTSSRESARYVDVGFADDDENFPLKGQIVFSDNQIDTGTGTLRIRAQIRNPELGRQPRYLLSPGQFVRVRLPVGNPREATLIPEKCLGTDQGQKYLFVVGTDNVAERRNVKIGPQYGDYRVIEGDILKPGERVIVDGLLRVRDRAKVDPKPAKPTSLPVELAVSEQLEEAPMPRRATNRVPATD